MAVSIGYENLLQRIPDEYRANVNLLGEFKGNRSRVLYLNKVCGCKKEYMLKTLLLRKNFGVCKECITKYPDSFPCKRCDKTFPYLKIYENHNRECSLKYSKLIEGIDYVVCSICGYCSISLGRHVRTKHNISSEEYKNNNQILAKKSFEKYSNQNKINGPMFWKQLQNDDQKRKDYLEKMGDAVSQSILANPAERKRRAEVMSAVNKSDVMRAKSSQTAIKTSARKDIQENRAAQLKRWRDNNPDEFYEKCIANMLNKFRSIPECILYDIVKSRNDYNFCSNQVIKSNAFITKSKRKQIDIGDKLRRVYIEFDGPLHFIQTKLDQLQSVQEKDRLLDNYIITHNWTLVRISYDQFSYRKSDYGFKPECIKSLFSILDTPSPGVHYIGAAYKND